MATDHPALAHILVSVVIGQIVQIHDERAGGRDDAPIHLDAELPFRKELELADELPQVPRLEVRIGTAVHTLNFPKVRLFEMPYDDAGLVAR